MGVRGGFEETPLGNSMYVVHSRVNGYTSQGTAVQYAYRRAAELCPSGFDLADKSDSSTSSYWRTSYGLEEINKPEVTIVVRCKAQESTWWCARVHYVARGRVGLFGAARRDHERRIDRLRRAVPARSQVLRIQKIGCSSRNLDHLARSRSVMNPGAPLDPDFVSKLFDASRSVRLLALASSPGIARRALTDANVELMQHVPVCVLAYRKGEIHQLMDRSACGAGACRVICPNSCGCSRGLTARSSSLSA
jgi:hypothetical protein